MKSIKMQECLSLVHSPWFIIRVQIHYWSLSVSSPFECLNTVPNHFRWRNVLALCISSCQSVAVRSGLLGFIRSSVFVFSFIRLLYDYFCISSPDDNVYFLKIYFCTVFQTIGKKCRIISLQDNKWNKKKWGFKQL